MARWDRHGCLWRCCCCGCLLPLVLLKICFVLPMSLLFCVTSATLVGIFYMLKGVPICTWTIFAQKDYGFKLKFLFFLIFLFPAALFLPVFIGLGVCAALFFGIGYPIAMTCDENKNVFFGLQDGPRELWDELKNVIRKLDNFLSEVRREGEREMSPGEVPTDIYWSDIFACLFGFVLALAFMYPLWVALITVKLLPFMLRCYIVLWKEYKCDSSSFCTSCCKTLAFPLLNVFLPVSVMFLYLLALCHGLVCCIYVIYVCYDYSFLLAVKYLCSVLHQYDRQSNGIICYEHPETHTKSLCDSCCVFHHDVELYSKTVVDLV